MRPKFLQPIKKVIFFKIDMDELLAQKILIVKEDHYICQREYGYASLMLLSKLLKHNLMRGFLFMSFKDNLLCE